MEGSGGPPPWQRSSALVLVDDLDVPQLSDDDAHHLSRVLRLRDGATVCASDGAGGWRLTRFDGTDALEPLGDAHQERRPDPPVMVGMALVKGDKPDLVVQKLTELGVDRIVFFHAARSVVSWNPQKVERNIARLSRVARSATCQSRRLWLPQVEFSELTALLDGGAVVADFDGRPLASSETTVLIGPEGGWEPGECGRVDRIDLGPNVLRAETAAIAAAVRLTTQRDCIGT